MSRYIDADKFYASQVKRCLGEPLIGTCTNDNALLRDEIQKFPAADVEEVKHGCWIDVPINVYNDMYEMNRYNLRTKCSACTYAMPYEYPRFHICPNCGARMDGGVKE